MLRVRFEEVEWRADIDTASNHIPFMFNGVEQMRGITEAGRRSEPSLEPRRFRPPPCLRTSMELEIWLETLFRMQRLIKVHAGSEAGWGPDPT